MSRSVDGQHTTSATWFGWGCFVRWFSLRQAGIAVRRRTFLKSTVGATVAAALDGCSTNRCLPTSRTRAEIVRPEIVNEPIVDPELPIIDAHHHLWLRESSLIQVLRKANDAFARGLVPVIRDRGRYLLEEFL